jgi:hypothetical protein
MIVVTVLHIRRNAFAERPVSLLTVDEWFFARAISSFMHRTIDKPQAQYRKEQQANAATEVAAVNRDQENKDVKRGALTAMR